MDLINRQAIVVLPRESLLDWVNEIFPDESKRLDDLVSQGNIYLIPELDTQEEAELHVELIYDQIFRNELMDWCADESLWPFPRTYDMFLEWFDILYDVVVFDTVEGPLEKE